MKYPHLYTTIVFCGALALGCVIDNTGNDTQSAPTSTSFTTTTTSAKQSGSVTSAPGSATDETASDSAPTMATASSTASTTSADPSSTGEPCSFLNCDDMMNSTDGCDTYAQDCPEGQKCTVYISKNSIAWDSTKCVEVTGTDKPGDVCTSQGAYSGVDSCIKGAMCWGVDMEGMGTCVALCIGTPDDAVCENKGLCTIPGGGGPLNLCLPVCDPLLQDCSGAGEACYPIADAFNCAPDASGEEGVANDPCEYINVCDEGLMCADAAFVGMGCPVDSTGCCTPFCKFPGGLCPNPDQECVQYFDPMMFPPNDPWLDIGSCGVAG